LDKRLEKIRRLSEWYETGLYTGPEIIGQTIDILADAADFAELWDDVPEWVQVEIWAWLKSVDRNTVLYGATIWGEIIPRHLIDLKVWLIQERRYE